MCAAMCGVQAMATRRIVMDLCGGVVRDVWKHENGREMEVCGRFRAMLAFPFFRSSFLMTFMMEECGSILSWFCAGGVPGVHMEMVGCGLGIGMVLIAIMQCSQWVSLRNST